MKKIKIEVQYFTGCPNSEEMIQNVREAIARTSLEIDYRETLVESPEAAERLKFRGSPTLLIDGKDFENLPEPEKASLTCRYYPQGLPAPGQIIKALEKKGKE